jgi:integrase
VIILDEGFRPGEIFTLRWSHVFLNDHGTGLIQIATGKSKAARRMLPTTPRVFESLLARYKAAGRPQDGWVFPSASRCGHFDGNAAKDQHKKPVESSGVEYFVPYVLRHTALTRLGEQAHGDVFVLARIAGHSSITVTQRYVHPQADAIQRVFTSGMGTNLGTAKAVRLGSGSMSGRDDAATN